MGGGVVEDARELAGVDHAGLVDDQDHAVVEGLLAAAPGVLPALEGASGCRPPASFIDKLRLFKESGSWWSWAPPGPRCSAIRPPTLAPFRRGMETSRCQPGR